jgi:glycoprotein-N-acetylgalactosamine 3-beta-galactosyltransferase
MGISISNRVFLPSIILGDRNDTFNSGGAGYTLNKAALKLLVVNGLSHYFAHERNYMEDLLVARIFRQLDVYPYDTKDETGGERYMHHSPGAMYLYQQPQEPTDYWYHKFAIDIKYGLDHCAARSVSFHYIRGDELKRLHALLYHHCPKQEIE